MERTDVSISDDVLDAIDQGWLVDAGWRSEPRGSYFGGYFPRDPDVNLKVYCPVWLWRKVNRKTGAERRVYAPRFSTLPTEVPQVIKDQLVDRREEALLALIERSKRWTWT